MSFAELLHKPLLPESWSRYRFSPWRIAGWWPSDTDEMYEQSFVRLLAAAHRHQMPIASVIRQHARENRGLHRWKLFNLARRIEKGMQTIDALEQTPGILSQDKILALRFGTQTGTLLPVLDLLQEHYSQERSDVAATLRQTAAYAAALGIVILFLAAFLSTFIFPTMEKMAEEFGMELPWSLTTAIQVIGSVAMSAFIWFIVLPACLLVLNSHSARMFVRRHVQRTADRFSSNELTANLLELLAIASKAGRPIASSLSTFARYHYNRSTRLRLLFVRNEVEQGTNVWDSLASVRLLGPDEAAVIRDSPTADARNWTLGLIANHRRLISLNRRVRFAALIQPLVVLCFAFVVAWLSIGFISFLADIISYLT